MKHKTEDYKISAVKYYLKNTDSSDLPTAKMDIENYHVGPPNVIFFIVFQYSIIVLYYQIYCLKLKGHNHWYKSVY